MCLKLNCSLLLLQSRVKSQLFEFATHCGRSHQIDHFTVVGLVTWPLNDSEAVGDLVLIDLTAFIVQIKLFLC